MRGYRRLYDARRQRRRSTPEFKDGQYFRKILKQHGMTRGDYEELLAKQDGVCAICLSLPKTRLCIDHDHRTGRVRGLLCKRCNSVLGYVDDGPTLLRRMVRYLEAK
jgi:hypothetical protein